MKQSFSGRSIFALSFVLLCRFVSSFNLVLMAQGGGRRRSKSISDELQGISDNDCGQDLQGVSLPPRNQVKGWEFGDNVRMACANVNGKFYALQGECPRCAFDLWKGDLIVDDPAWTDLPRLACPTCSTTYGLRSGVAGPPLKRTGLQAFVANLAQTSTKTDTGKRAKAYVITRDEDGKIYCRER